MTPPDSLAPLRQILKELRWVIDVIDRNIPMRRGDRPVGWQALCALPDKFDAVLLALPQHEHLIEKWRHSASAEALDARYRQALTLCANDLEDGLLALPAPQENGCTNCGHTKRDHNTDGLGECYAPNKLTGGLCQCPAFTDEPVALLAETPHPKCPNGKHQWTNQFGEDWTPDFWALCDCGERAWGGLSKEAGALINPAAETLQGWQPIETAPKDITVLVYDEGTICMATYLTPEERWYDHGYMTPGPTHWMPLPAPPGARPAGENT